MITIGDIVDFMQAKDSLYEFAEEAGNMPISGPSPISEAKIGHITFCNAKAKNSRELLSKTKASFIIVDSAIPIDKDSLTAQGVQAIILSDHARLDFIRVMKHFFTHPISKGVHPSAAIAPTAVIAPSAYIGPFCSIGHDVRIGERTIIHSGVHIYENVHIGQDVIINSGTVIGADGFGYERNNVGELEKFPHVGGVVIEDNVEIHALVHIARGTLGDTVIGQGTKIDSFCHIAHNVKIGKNCMIISHAMLGGSVNIGENSWIAPCACLREKIKIGSGVTIGLLSLVTKDVPDGQTVMGTPARPVDEQKRLLERLSELAADE
jgi:UDP-3-O-[3-hydroxymyristoyl] glucosamine N-acyltransferase